MSPLKRKTFCLGLHMLKLRLAPQKKATKTYRYKIYHGIYHNSGLFWLVVVASCSILHIRFLIIYYCWRAFQTNAKIMHSKQNSTHEYVLGKLCIGSSYLICLSGLTHWGRVTHICVSELSIIGSDNGLSPGRRQAIIWNNAGLLLIEPLGTNVTEISIGIQAFSFKKMHFHMLSAKWPSFCLGLNVLIHDLIC